jgi:hypothetical protein
MPRSVPLLDRGLRRRQARAVETLGPHGALRPVEPRSAPGAAYYSF